MNYKETVLTYGLEEHVGMQILLAKILIAP